MRGVLALFGTAMAAFLLLNGCAKPMFTRSEQRPSFYEVANKSEHFVKKAAISVKPGAVTYIGRQADALLLQKLTDTIRKKNEGLRLLTPADADYPAFMKVYHPISIKDAFFVTQTARRQGYHSLLQAGVENIRVHEKKTGMWWFRKTRYFMTVVVSLDAFDTFTAAKMYGEVREKTVPVDPDTYAAFLSGSAQNIEQIDALIVDMAGELGEQAADAIAESKWVTSVAEVQNPHISLTSGSSAGLRVGDRLSIFEGRRVIDGLDGEKFIAPGYKVADVQITAVDETGAQASLAEPADIRPGDIAVPAM